MKKPLLICISVVVVVAVTFLIVGMCSAAGDYDAEIDSGRVTKNDGRHKITVYEDDHEYDKHKVTRKIARKCVVGSRWPDCKR